MQVHFQFNGCSLKKQESQSVGQGQNHQVPMSRPHVTLQAMCSSLVLIALKMSNL